MIQAILNLFKPRPIMQNGREVSEHYFRGEVYRQPALFSTVYENTESSKKPGVKVGDFVVMAGSDLDPKNDFYIPRGTKFSLGHGSTLTVKTSMDMECLFDALETEYMEPF